MKGIQYIIKMNLIRSKRRLRIKNAGMIVRDRVIIYYDRNIVIQLTYDKKQKYMFNKVCCRRRFDPALDPFQSQIILFDIDFFLLLFNYLI